MDLIAYWKSRAETAELKVLTFNEEIAKLRPDSGGSIDSNDSTQYWRGIAQRLASELFDARVAAKEAGYGSGSVASVIRNLTELSATARRALDDLTLMRKG